MAAGKKNAARRGATLIFIDETGFLLQPWVRRTWAPRGQTPVLRERRHHHRRLSAIGGLTVSPRRRHLNLYLQFHADCAIRGVQVVQFLRHVRRHVRTPLQIVWDRLGVHRARPVQTYLRRHAEVRITQLPAYAPELNPIESGWAYLKMNPLANFCPGNVAELRARIDPAVAALRGRPHLLAGCLRNTPLPIRLPCAPK